MVLRDAMPDGGASVGGDGGVSTDDHDQLKLVLRFGCFGIYSLRF